MNREALSRIKKKIIWIYQCAYGFKLAICLYTLLGVASSLLGIVYVLTFKQMVDIATQEAEGSLFTVIFFIAGIFLVQELLAAVQSATGVRLNQKLENKLKQTVFRETLHSRYQELMRYHSGDLVNRIDKDSSTVVSFLTSTVPGVVICIVKLSAAFATMLLLDSMVAVFSVITLPAVILLVRLFLKKLKKLNREYREASSENTAFLQESLQNAFVLKAFGAETAREGRLAFLQDKLLRIAVKRNLIGVLSNSTLSIGFSAGYILAFLFGSWRMMQGMITFGTVSAFLQLVREVQNPLYSLAGIVPAMVSLSVAAERLMELLELEKEEACERCLDGSLQISLSHVSVGYENDRKVLEDISYVFGAGRATAVIGKTGEGKTTLIRLLLGFLEPSEGTVRIGNDRESMTNGASARANYTYVPQGNTVLSGTIRDNLLEAGTQASEEEIGLALRCACAEFVSELPAGLDTVIGEKGIGLSEGQSLRLAIVRALLKKAPVMIFDESTAALDEETQAEVFGRIRGEYSGKTLIFITHKLSMAAYCDDIIKISNGKLYQVKKEELQYEILHLEEKGF